MDDDVQINVPAAHADALQRLAAVLRDRDLARGSNDPRQQRTLRLLAYERLEQLLGELFPDVYALANDIAAISPDLVEPEPGRDEHPTPHYRAYDMTLLRDDPRAAREATAILAHFLGKAASRLPPGLGEAAAAALWLQLMDEATWLGRRSAPDGGRIAFRNRILAGLVYYEWGYYRDCHQTRDAAAEHVLAGFPRIAIIWKSLERDASASRGNFVALGQYCEGQGRRDRALGAAYSPPYGGYLAALRLQTGDLPRQKRQKAGKSRKS